MFLYKLFACFFLLLVTVNCSQNREEINDKLIEKLNSQIKSVNYEQIYDELSDTAKSLTPKQEFLERINKAVEVMRKVDNSLLFQKDKNVRLSNNVYRDLYFEYRKIESIGEKLNIEITLKTSYTAKIYDLCISPSETETVENQICITNALRKI
jgi:hypothetical protein